MVHIASCGQPSCSPASKARRIAADIAKLPDIRSFLICVKTYLAVRSKMENAIVG
jgi:hypothetical protein